MRTSTLAVVSILAAAVSAQSVPASCERVVALVQSCVPQDVTEEELTGGVVANCLCSGDDSFDNDVVDCIKEAGSLLPEESQSALEAFRGYCSLFAGGGGGSPGNTGSPTSPSETSDAAETSEPAETTGPAETGEPVPTGSENCNYIVQGLSRCWTDDSPLPTAAPVARCLCSGTDFDSAIEGCYSDIVDDYPKEASTFAAFASFCSSFSNGAFGGSGPTVTGDDSATTGAPDPTEDSTSTGRVIQTLDPETTGPSTTGASTTGGGNGPNSAAGLKVTILGTALAAILAGAALIL